MDVRIQTGAVEPLSVFALTPAGNPATGLATLVVRVRRKSNGQYLDWADNTFKSSGWTTLNGALTELDPVNAAGLYSRDFDTSAIANKNPDDIYTVIPDQTSGNTRLPAPSQIYEGDYVDDIVQTNQAVVSADLVVAAGSTATIVRTNATQADGFYDNMIAVVLNAAGVVARGVQGYLNANGEFTLSTPLPFTPVSGDRLIVLARPDVQLAAGASDIAEAVWDELLAGHTITGSAGAILGFGFVGARQITITVEDTGAVPLPNVQVDFFDSTNTVFLGRRTTDGSGQFTLALNDATYQLRLVKTGFAFTTPETLVVSADASETFVGTGVSITPPSAPDLCTVFGTVRDAGGEILAGADVEAFAITPQVVAGIQKAERVAHSRTDQNGFFEIELVRNTTVRFTIQGTNLDVERVVPDLASQDVTTWT